MSTINRTVYTGQPEPSPLSMRLPARQETRLAVTFRNQNGVIVNTDLGASLELAARSGAPSLFYTMSPTDIANGMSRTTIPEGDLTDPNGYTLWMRGRIGGEPALLATGTVVLQDITLPGMGLPAAGTGGGAPGPGIERIDLILHRGGPVSLLVSIWGDEGATIPVDLTGQALVANISSFAGGTALTSFSISPGPNLNQVWIGLSAAQLDALPDSCWWTLVGGAPVGASTTYCEGAVTITGATT